MRDSLESLFKVLPFTDHEGFLVLEEKHILQASMVQHACSVFRTMSSASQLLQVNRELQYMLGAGAGAMEEVNTWHRIPLLARQVVVFDLECAHDALRGTYGARGENLGTHSVRRVGKSPGPSVPGLFETPNQWEWKRRCQIIEFGAVDAGGQAGPALRVLLRPATLIGQDRDRRTLLRQPKEGWAHPAIRLKEEFCQVCSAAQILGGRT